MDSTDASLDIIRQEQNEEVPWPFSIFSNCSDRTTITQEKSARISALIASAAQNQDARYTLRQIYEAISQSGSGPLLVRIIDSVNRIYPH
jgi:hypothetical protein